MSIISALAHDKNVILYRKELNKITGSVTASILLQQVIYWHNKVGGEFYKFILPCSHPLYKSGDSWTEELGFSRKEFTTAMKRLETAGLVSKRITGHRITYYSLNVPVLDGLLAGVYKSNSPKGDLLKPERGSSKSPKGDLHLYTETTTETTTENILSSSANIDRAAVKQKSKRSEQNEAAKHLIEYLNQKAGRKFRATPTNLKLITARLSEGYKPADVARVIERKCAEWLNDPQMSQYLRPSTLFNATKFNDYVGQIDTPLPEKRGDQSNGLSWDDTSWMEGMENDPF